MFQLHVLVHFQDRGQGRSVKTDAGEFLPFGCYTDIAPSIKPTKYKFYFGIEN